MFDKKAYFEYSNTLEKISMVRFAILMLLYILSGYFIGEYIIKNVIIGIIGGIIIGIVMQYLSYLKEQIKVEEMRMLIEIHNNIVNKREL